MQIAYFVSSHGFGHAARAAAVMTAVHARRPDAHFHVFGQTPAWFFVDSVAGPYTYHEVQTDVGFVQVTPIQVDLDETLRRLDAFLRFEPDHVARLAEHLVRAGCRLVLCDISALGLAVARAAGLPSALISNFTWDWIYAGYFDQAPRLRAHAQELQGLYASATYRVLTEPFCQPGPADLVTRPVARAPRETVLAVRRRLGLPARTKAVLITMGGVQPRYDFLGRLKAYRGVWFVIPGAGQRWEQDDNLVLLPHHSPIYHPDLVNSCDAVIGKLGYSTLAEAYHAGVPYGFIRRPGFRESEVLGDYVTAHMPSADVPEAAFETGEWETFLPGLLAQPRHAPAGPNGAEALADFILQLRP